MADAKPDKPFEQDSAAPLDEQKPIEDATAAVETGAKKRPTYAADNAVAVSCNDLQALVEHARQTGAEALAAKFPNL